MGEHTHNAWVVGVHPIPNEAATVEHAPGEVIIQDLENHTWEVISLARFNREFEWIT